VNAPRGRPAWRLAGERLAQAVGRARLHPAVRAWAEGRPAREPWAVALSGGADSVALLLLLWGLWPARRSRLRAIHFDHRLRGRAARADAAFCRRLCAALGVAFSGGAWTDRAAAGLPAGRPVGGRRAVSEASAREARFAFFRRELGRRRIRVLWLGHHQGDIAESMLMRLARGSGTAGLAAPRPIQAMPAGRIHLRPLLTLRKEELRGALRAAGASWREDATNGGGAFFRNRVRRSVIPAWRRAAGRDAEAGAALARERLEEDDVALEAWVDALDPLTRGGALRLDRLKGLPRAVARRALHRWLLRVGREGLLSRQGFEALLAAVERGVAARHSLGVEGFAVLRGDRLRLGRGPAARRN
jgi:tRNA(Ile)-lysidine synthase